MRAPFLLFAITLAACSGDKPPPASAANPQPSLAEHKDAVPPHAAPEPADMAASEAEPRQPVADVCDLKGYDMSKMTVDQHEELVKQCQRSKQ
jgi:hypothetical protein